MTNPVIIVADDDAGIRTVIETALTRESYVVKSTGSYKEMMNMVKNGEGNLVITDVVMPDGNGLEAVPVIKSLRPDLRVVVISAKNTALTALEAAKKGAFEYLPKPFDLNELVDVIKRAVRLPRISETREKAVKEKNELLDIPIVGRSQVMQGVYKTLAKLMNNDLTVMITGESGTGKELIARALHNFGHRRTGPFIAINMAAIPKTLIESEMFGHEKGAYTGATSRSPGQFERAEGGTLFLDEIGDMPLDVQTRLLRVLQEGEYTTLGGRTVKKSNVRIIAATNRDLKAMVQGGSFREDLYYRLNVVPIALPPLRDRREDLNELVEKFVVQAAAEGLPRKIFSEDAMRYMFNYDWPGNVRELENFVRRMTILCNDEVVKGHEVKTYFAQQKNETISPNPIENIDFKGKIETVEKKEDSKQTFVDINKEGLADAVSPYIKDYLKLLDDDMPEGNFYDLVIKEVEKPLIQSVLDYTNGNQIKTASILGINRNTLRKKIKELNISVVKRIIN